MFRATLDTKNFHFEGFGHTREAAIHALRRGLQSHGTQYRMYGDWYVDLIGDAAVQEITVGVCYRDNEAIA